MNKSSSDDAIKNVARKYGVPVKVVVAEIERGIDEVMQNPDPLVRERWKNMPWKGRKPTAAEFIDYISRCLEKGRSPY